MTGCPCTAVCRWSIVASLTALCLWQGLVTASAYLESSDAYAYLTAWRAAAKNAPGEKLALLRFGRDWYAEQNSAELNGGRKPLL